MKSYFFTILSILLFLLSNCRSTPNEKKDELNHQSDNEDSLSSQITYLTGLISANRMNADLFLKRSKLFAASLNLEDALTDAKVAVRLDSTRPDLHYHIAGIYFSQQKMKLASDALEKCTKRDSRYIDAYLKLAEIFLLVGNYEKTSENLKKAMEIDPNRPLVFYMLGIMFKETGDTLRSTTSFQKAVEYNPGYFDAHLELGILLTCKKDMAAFSYLNNAINLRPAAIDALYARGIFYQENNEPEKALNQYNAILLLDTNFIDAWYNSGYVNCVLLEKYQEAITFFDRAIFINPKFAEAFYMRGLCYEKTGKTEFAKQNYFTSLKFKENYDLAIEGLNRLDK